jgi:lipopolysaccharide/colanic/teichoic acid biosynthesis glycosyltransferase/ubiquinone/menaquinone biosynthesis C-methylase UbiE
MLKRLFDILASAAALLFFSPLLLVIALRIKLNSPGPIFYRGRRAGRFEKPFRIFKFRTMVINADKIGGPSTSDDDPRITQVGRFMRKYKIDELPQLLNVLVGEMSIVGPRPQVPDYVARFIDEEKKVLQLRPGITDWASIWNSDEGAVLAGHADPDKAYDELIHPTKMKLQLLYARKNNVLVDLKIIFSTLLRLIKKDWLPSEIRSFPKPGSDRANSDERQGYETVTELPGVGATNEQLAMLYTRYGWAGQFALGKDVLEIACGSGIGLGHLAHHARRVVGGEYDPKLAEIARQQYCGQIQVEVMNAESLPFPDQSLDVVALLEAIYYLPQPETFVREARRVLRPNGTLLICSANCERPDFNPSPFSMQYFSASKLRSMLERNGFQTKVSAAFPLSHDGWQSKVRQVCRNVAVKLHLIPKTMRWKARVKRLFFGKLQVLPTALGRELPPIQQPVPIDGSNRVTNYAVIYIEGIRKAQEQRTAA